MATTASSFTLPNLPYRWRRKAYMRPDHITAQVDRLHGSASTSALPTTGPSTGSPPCNSTRYKDSAAQTLNIQEPQDGNDVVTTCKEPGLPLTPSSTPSMENIHTINYNPLLCKLKYMRKIIEERKRAANGEQDEKENMALPPRPLKRKRAAPRPTPAAPVRQSKRLQQLQQKGQRRGEEGYVRS